MLSFAPDFVAKTQKPGDPLAYFEDLAVPSLADFVGSDPAEMLLCPVRAMRYYIRRTAPYRPVYSTRLFLGTGRAKKEVARNTISFWIRRVVRLAYSEMPDGEPALSKVPVHEVRALSTSVLFRRNLSLGQVMRAAQWRCASTFSSFYLRDLTHKYLDTFSLGPLVAAQSVI